MNWIFVAESTARVVPWYVIEIVSSAPEALMATVVLAAKLNAEAASPEAITAELMASPLSRTLTALTANRLPVFSEKLTDNVSVVLLIRLTP